MATPSPRVGGLVYCLPFALVFPFVGRRAFLGNIRGLRGRIGEGSKSSENARYNHLCINHPERGKTNIPRAHLRSYKERLRHLCKVIGANIPRPLWRSLRVHRWGSRNALQRNLNRWLLREGEYPRSASHGTDGARGVWGLHGVAISPTV